MKVCAIICEYNPFHLGHRFQLRSAREQTGCDYLICAMSGPFVQRGEPAVIDKWTRAHSALEMGADLVLELPAIHALRAARDFAFGAVALLHGLNVVTHLSFGSEFGDLCQLTPFTTPETPAQSQCIKDALAQGHSHAKAMALAYGQELPANALLGVEYLRAIRTLGAPFAPVPVRRSPENTEGTPLKSSSAIRKALFAGQSELAFEALPEATRPLVAHAQQVQGGLVCLAHFDQLLLHSLRAMSPAQLRQYPGINEGFENRLHKAARECGSIHALLAQLQTRRYPLARIRRSLMHILLGNTSALLQANPLPQYARVLGFRRSAEPLLGQIAQHSQLPLVTKVAQHKENALLQQDIRAQDLWALAQPNPAARSAGQDFTRSPIIL